MKKTFLRAASLVTSIALIFSITAFAADDSAVQPSVTESPDISIVISGSLRTYQQVPIIVSGSTFLPLRALATDLGIPNDNDHIIWNQSEKSVTLKSADGAKEVYLKIDDLNGKINQKDYTLNAAPVLYKNSTYIPVRFVADALGMNVIWDNKDRRVYIKDLAEFNSIKTIISRSYFVNPMSTAKYKYSYEVEQTETDPNSGVKLSAYNESGTVNMNFETFEFTKDLVANDGKGDFKLQYKYANNRLTASANNNTTQITDKDDIKDTMDQIFSMVYLRNLVIDEEDSDVGDDSGDDEEEGASFYDKMASMMSLQQNSDNTVTISGDLAIIQDEEDKVQKFVQTFIIDKDTCLIKQMDVEYVAENDEDGTTVLFTSKRTVKGGI